jgi:predicted RNA-binding Zn ribbon-like protein
MVRNEFLFLGGDVALDLLNTEIVRDGWPVDLLDSPAALAHWLAEAQLSSRGLNITRSVLAAVKDTRAALRELAGALADGKPLRNAPLALLDRELSRGRGALALRRNAEAVTLAFEPDPARARDVRFVLARAAASFLAMADPTRIRRCGGAKCVLFFYDATKSGTRRWCSMASCGNRMKAALHYQRKRAL